MRYAATMLLPPRVAKGCKQAGEEKNDCLCNLIRCSETPTFQLNRPPCANHLDFSIPFTEGISFASLRIHVSGGDGCCGRLRIQVYGHCKGFLKAVFQHRACRVLMSLSAAHLCRCCSCSVWLLMQLCSLLVQVCFIWRLSRLTVSHGYLPTSRHKLGPQLHSPFGIASCLVLKFLQDAHTKQMSSCASLLMTYILHDVRNITPQSSNCSQVFMPKLHLGG